MWIVFAGAVGAVPSLVRSLRDEDVSVSTVVPDLTALGAAVRVRAWLQISDGDAAHRGDPGVGALGARVVAALSQFNHSCAAGSATLGAAPPTWDEGEPQE